jgi:hypothetical protein
MSDAVNAMSARVDRSLRAISGAMGGRRGAASAVAIERCRLRPDRLDQAKVQT